MRAGKQTTAAVQSVPTLQQHQSAYVRITVHCRYSRRVSLRASILISCSYPSIISQYITGNTFAFPEVCRLPSIISITSLISTISTTVYQIKSNTLASVSQPARGGEGGADSKHTHYQTPGTTYKSPHKEGKNIAIAVHACRAGHHAWRLQSM